MTAPKAATRTAVTTLLPRLHRRPQPSQPRRLLPPLLLSPRPSSRVHPSSSPEINRSEKKSKKKTPPPPRPGGRGRLHLRRCSLRRSTCPPLLPQTLCLPFATSLVNPGALKSTVDAHDTRHVAMRRAGLMTTDKSAEGGRVYVEEFYHTIIDQ